MCTFECVICLIFYDDVLLSIIFPLVCVCLNRKIGRGVYSESEL